MGLLSLGTPFQWEESKQYHEHVRDNGIIQLINMFKFSKDRKNDIFYWGDEIEYMLVKIDETHKNIKLSIDQDFILDNLNEGGKSFERAVGNNVLFHPEYGRFMIEATPLRPYNGDDFLEFETVEKNMQLRRLIAISELENKTVIPLTLTSFPLMGVKDFTDPETKPNGEACKSLFLPDEIINRHVRFPTLTSNIRRRRGSKVAINIPLFKDTNTRKDSEFDPTIPRDRNLFPFYDNEAQDGAALPGHIYMDSMGFGMGSSCLQVTMQAPDVNEARFLYDSLVNIAPLMLSLTAAAPIFRGFLADQDVRWNVISGAVDDRTPYERGVEPLPSHDLNGSVDAKAVHYRIPKSRYNSVDQYLGDINSKGEFSYFSEAYNDIESPINEKVLKKLKENGFDQTLANHFAHLFIRDPLVIFNERVDQDNSFENDHFENIQSTNWQTLRFKPPQVVKTETTNGNGATPADNAAKGPGWRVELRPMEISITDFENAAFADFSVILSKMILVKKPNFYLPMSKVEANMETAHKTDSIIKSKFFIRTNIDDNGPPIIEELTLDEIFNGCKSFKGLIPLVKKFLQEYYYPQVTQPTDFKEKIDIYLKLIELRTTGKIKSTARYIRDFVRAHPDYKKDSVVSDEIAFDLIQKLNQLTRYEEDVILDFFGDEISKYMIDRGYPKIHQTKV